MKPPSIIVKLARLQLYNNGLKCIGLPFDVTYYWYSIMSPPHPSRVKGLFGSPVYLLCTLWTRTPCQGPTWFTFLSAVCSVDEDPMSRACLVHLSIWFVLCGWGPRVKGLFGHLSICCVLCGRGPPGYPWRHPKHMHISPQTDPSSTWPRERAI
jgi:hypothetical protein